MPRVTSLVHCHRNSFGFEGREILAELVDGDRVAVHSRIVVRYWNERMWSDGEPIDPSPTIDQAVNGGFPWLEVRCARCKTLGNKAQPH